MKQYLISGKQLNTLKKLIKEVMGDEYSITDCAELRLIEDIKSKTPVEIIAKGELFLSQENGITIIKDGKFINVDEKLYKYQGKKVRILIGEIE
jgi:hypothetical protein